MNPNELEQSASYHSLIRIKGVLSGDSLDLKMFHQIKWEFVEEISEEHCKFEMAEPAIDRPDIKVSFTNVTPDSTIEPDVNYMHHLCLYHMLCHVTCI
ncbi:hypothetical protein PHET_09791 [Paragonimus heterotremus]|uniref:Uncharacterized protein n=1 Tax=Paragonimus heterotremus TaxID=100268 RepID=A0A8J4SV91_9TREM|nr:hypothetical protein PHET_09791 [Paragonimus heterotremus]